MRQSGDAGRVLRTVTLGGLRITEVIYGPDVHQGAHEHPRASAAFMIAGGVEETVDGRTECGTVGSVVVKPAFARHADRFSPVGARVLIVEPSERLLDRCGWWPALSRCRWVHSGPIVRRAVSLYGGFSRCDGVSSGAVEERALELLDGLGPGQDHCGSVPRWLREVRDRLHFAFPKGLRLQDLADGVGIHPCHLARVFRRHTGCSISEYVRRLRLQRASQLLIDTDLPLAEIAVSSGFCDQPHLQRDFKHATGVTPRQYRRMR